MGEAEEQHQNPTALGASVRFFQCGADITIQATSEGLKRLASIIRTASENSGKTETTYTDPDEQNPGVIRIENVDALTTSEPAGRKLVVPVMSIAGVIWVIVLPVVGVLALLWLFIRFVI